MDKTARANLLRERLRAVRGPAFALRLPPAKAKSQAKWRPFENSIHFTVGQHAKELRQSWLYQPKNSEPETILPIRRIARKSPLLEIAEKWDAALRLPKRPLARRR